jgi:hypothetical protein
MALEASVGLLMGAYAFAVEERATADSFASTFSQFVRRLT